MLAVDQREEWLSTNAAVGWADVATKQDLAALETRMDARFEALETRTGKVEDKIDETSREIRAKT